MKRITRGMWGACAGAAFAAAVGLGATAAEAATAAEINTKVDAAIAKCYAEITGCKALGHKSVGMLVFPDVTKAAIGVGGSYGEGALRVGGKTTAYYSTSSASIGLSIGAQESSQIIMFLTQAALEDFRNSSGWEIGANASVAVIDTGKSGSFDSETVTDPVVGFIFGETGLMADLSLKGAKIKKIEP